MSTAQRFDEQQDGSPAEPDKSPAEPDESPESSRASEPPVFEEDLFDEADEEPTSWQDYEGT